MEKIVMYFNYFVATLTIAFLFGLCYGIYLGISDWLGQK